MARKRRGRSREWQFKAPGREWLIDATPRQRIRYIRTGQWGSDGRDNRPAKVRHTIVQSTVGDRNRPC